MNSRILETLEYPKIRTRLAELTITQDGQEQALSLTPSSRRPQVQQWLAETQDGFEIDRLGLNLPLEPTKKIDSELKRLHIEAVLNGTELAKIKTVLQNANQLRDFLNDLRQQGANLPSLYRLGQKLVPLPTISQRLEAAIDEQGNILDTASPELKQIRTTLKRTQQRVRERMERYLQSGQRKYLTENLITVRDDHLVLPVKAEARQHFGGVIHDQSASGQTIYVEPQGVINLNNTIQTQKILEKQVIAHILADLSALLRPYQAQLREDAWLVGRFDFINSKVTYAKQLKATQPQLSDEQHFAFYQARHPLLPQDQVVPNDIILGQKYRNLIITGPNTGGKTLTLKTAGLLQLMVQSGLFIPAGENSQAAIFDEIYADIGDEQSIEQNLSTFSSHMENIIWMSRHLNAHTLVLLDELGAGTDPQEGAALAIAIVESFSQSHCQLMITTHYPELKVFAYNYPATINASMEFDTKTLQPTYRLLIGIPGSSNAFDIAARLGMPADVVQRARQLQPGASHDLNVMIQDLEKQRNQYEQEAQDYHKQRQTLQRQQQDLDQQRQKLQNQKAQLLDQAQAKANQLVDQAQQQAAKIIAQLRQWQQQGRLDIKDDQLIRAQTQLNQLHQQRALQKNRVLRREKRKQQIKVGDEVHVNSYDQDGVVIGQDKKGNFEVQLGILKMRLPQEQLTKLKKTPTKAATSYVSRQRAHDNLPLQLDLRGKRYEEAMQDLDQYLDAALLAGYQEVTIIHGFGTGVIRKGVQKYLSHHPRIKKFQYAPASAGGQGATIVQLR